MNLPRSLISRFAFLCLLLSSLLAPSAWGEFTHVVKKGESLSSIARKYHLPVSRVQDANHLEGTKIVIGCRLLIPQKPSLGESRPDIQKISPLPLSRIAAPETYAVKQGDTLAKIARRYHLRVKDLAALNELQGGRLRNGQVLRLRPSDKPQELESDGTELKGDEVQGANEDPSAVRLEKESAGKEREPNKLLQVAQNFLGVRYRRGGTSHIYGLDCSGYVQKVFQTVGVDLPRTAREQFELGLDVARDALRLGDLVFFKRQKDSHPSHVGIYIGNQQFIHASVSKRRVNIDSLESRYFSARFIGGKRIGEMDKNPGTKRPDAERVYVWETRFETPCCLSDPPPLQ